MELVSNVIVSWAIHQEVPLVLYVIVIVIVLFIAPYSPKGGIGLNTTKV